MAHLETEAVEHDIASAAAAIEAKDEESYEEILTEEAEEVAPEEASETEETEVTEEQDEEPVEVIQAPVSWSPEQKEVFSSLPPEVQQVIVDRESARDRGFQEKATEFAEQRKALRVEQQGIEQERLFYAQYLESQIPPEPDPMMLNSNSPYYNPDQYHWQQAQRRQVTEQLEHAKAHWKGQYEAEKTKHLEGRELELNKIYPESLNEGFLNSVTEYAGKYGFDSDVLEAATAPELVILDKARLYDALMEKKPSVKKKVEEAPKVQKPGAKSNSDKYEANQAKRNKLRKSGRLEDAAALFMED